MASCQRMAKMRPDQATTRCVEVSTAHKCPPGYGEGATAVRPSAAGANPCEPSQACPETCTDILKDQEKRSRERRQLECLPGDLKIGEPKICPPGFPMEQNCPSKQTYGRNVADPSMCPPKFSVGRSPEMPTGQDPRCNVDYQKCAPKRRPGVCGPTDVGTSLDHNPLCSREKTKSRELIGGVLLTGCDCVKRNGLQHDCRRTLCQGRPECLTNPPMCLPSGGPGCIPTSYFDC